MRRHSRCGEEIGISLNATKIETALFPIMLPAAYPLRTVNCYLLQENGTVSLIDSGLSSDECWEKLTADVAAHGFCLRDIDRIILTHSHPDHIGFAGRIARQRSIPVYAHREAVCRLRRDEDFLMRRIEFFRELYRSLGCGEDGECQVRHLREAVFANRRQRVDADIVPLEDGDVACGLEIISTPGHAPDHIALRHSQQRWLFGGDLLLGHMSSNALIEPDSSGRRLPTLVQYIASLRKTMDLDAETVYPGHGMPIHRFRDLCLTRLQGIGKRAEKIRGFVARGVRVPRDIAVAYYRELYRQEFAFVMSEVIGYLDYLELEGKVCKERIDGVWHYTDCM